MFSVTQFTGDSTTAKCFMTRGMMVMMLLILTSYSPVTGTEHNVTPTLARRLLKDSDESAIHGQTPSAPRPKPLSDESIREKFLKKARVYINVAEDLAATVAEQARPRVCPLPDMGATGTVCGNHDPKWGLQRCAECGPGPADELRYWHHGIKPRADANPENRIKASKHGDFGAARPRNAEELALWRMAAETRAEMWRREDCRTFPLRQAEALPCPRCLEGLRICNPGVGDKDLIPYLPQTAAQTKCKCVTGYTESLRGSCQMTETETHRPYAIMSGLKQKQKLLKAQKEQQLLKAKIPRYELGLKRSCKRLCEAVQSEDKEYIKTRKIIYSMSVRNLTRAAGEARVNQINSAIIAEFITELQLKGETPSKTFQQQDVFNSFERLL